MRAGKKAIAALLLLAAVVLGMPSQSRAASGVIQFSAENDRIQRGDVFTVICQVTSPGSFLDTEFIVNFDSDKLRFIRGGGKVTASGGTLRFTSVGNETPTTKKTFSLQFEALKKGLVSLEVDGTARMTDSEGEPLSVSSNRLFLRVVKRGEADSSYGTSPEPSSDLSSEPTQVPAVTPAPAKSGENRLKELDVAALGFHPFFSPEQTEYEAEVDCHTDTLYVTFRAADSHAVVKLSGNKNLKEGVNPVRVVVTAENGSKRVYRIAVTKESARETAKREKKSGSGGKNTASSGDGDSLSGASKNSGDAALSDSSENDGNASWGDASQGGGMSGANQTLAFVIAGLVMLVLILIFVIIKMSMKKKAAENDREYLDF